MERGRGIVMKWIRGGVVWVKGVGDMLNLLVDVVGDSFICMR